MAFIDFNFYSNVLEKQTAAYVLTPDSGKGPFPVFYLLHGLGDNHTIWLRRTRIEQYIGDLPLILVMPDGGRSFYTNANEGRDYSKFIGEELTAKIESTFHAKTTGKARCIGGLSMGGYGALRNGLGYPGRYVSVNSHSGAVQADQLKRILGPPGELERIFAPYRAGSDHDLLTLAKKAKKLGQLPRLRLDCGTDDFLIGENRSYHAALEKAGVPHEYAEFPGVHNWDYWDIHVQEAIAFHCKALGIKR